MKDKLAKFAARCMELVGSSNVTCVPRGDGILFDEVLVDTSPTTAVSLRYEPTRTPALYVQYREYERVEDDYNLLDWCAFDLEGPESLLSEYALEGLDEIVPERKLQILRALAEVVL